MIEVLHREKLFISHHRPHAPFVLDKLRNFRSKISTSCKKIHLYEAVNMTKSLNFISDKVKQFLLFK